MLRRETIDRALKEIAKGEAQRNYFFAHAKSPEWLVPLAEAGYFQQPPPPIADGQYISFPFWEQTRYLARMAKIPDAQTVVLDIADKVPETENVRVHEDLLDVALAVPAAAATRLVPRIIDCVKSPYKFSLPYKLRDFVPHLANGGEGTAALRVAREALTLRAPALREDEDNEFYTPQPLPLFRDYDYNNIVDRAISPLAKAVGAQAVSTFADLLENAICLVQRPGEADDEDNLYIWQPDLNSGPRFNRATNVLLCATRRIAEEAVRIESQNFDAILRDLKRRRWISFRRLALHLCAVFPDLGASESAHQLANADVLDRPSTRLEAKALLKTSYARLPNDVRESILLWIERGPDRNSAANWLGESASPRDIDDYCHRWRRDQLALIEGQLPADWEERLGDLVALLGPPNPPTPAVRFSTLVKPDTPADSEKLDLLSPEQIVSYLQDWKPTPGPLEASMEGLGRVLTKVVARRAEEFARHAAGFQVVDPTYVSAYFQGLLNVRKNNDGFTWDPVLALAEWVVGQPREIPGRTGGLMDRDPDWGWTRRSILNLIEESLGEDDGSLRLEHRERVWRVLRPLTDDPHPTPEDEAKSGGNYMDPATMAINTVRGVAFNCLVRFALWVRALDKNSSEAQSPARSLETMPEVREVLDSHLDTGIEPSLTIRSIYGRWLPFLAALDWDWTVASLPRIFPEDPADIRRLLAAWESFVVFNNPNTKLFPVLLPLYRAAIGRVSTVPSLMKHLAAPEERLAQHLAVYYREDELQLDEPGGLLPQFFNSTPPGVRGHLIWFVGHAVSDVPPVVFDRLRALLEQRLRAAREADSPEEFASELSRFGCWFTSKRFGDRWSLTILQEVLDLVGEIDLEMHVAERLVELAPEFPLKCVNALTTMIVRAKEPWLIVAVEDSAKQVLRIALDSGNSDALFAARKLVEDLIGRNYFDFRHLLQE